jgi:hypothetical protein
MGSSCGLEHMVETMSEPSRQGKVTFDTAYSATPDIVVAPPLAAGPAGMFLALRNLHCPRPRAAGTLTKDTSAQGTDCYRSAQRIRDLRRGPSSPERLVDCDRVRQHLLVAREQCELRGEQ